MNQDITLNIVNDFARYFLSIVLEALPFVVLGVIIAGILEEFVPQTWIRNLFGESISARKKSASGFAFWRMIAIRLGAIALGGFLGLIFPMCECGIIAIMRRLIRKGVPLSVCICYMLAGPIINIVVLLSTYVAFNFPSEDERVFSGPLQVTLLRAGLGFSVAFVTAVIVEFLHRLWGSKALLQPSLIADSGNYDETKETNAARPFKERLRNISETALHDFVDIMTFLVLGACLASVGRMSLENTEVKEFTRYWIESGTPVISIGIMMFIAVAFCLCSEADAFVAANFPKVWPPASKMAFMVLGPMFDLKLLVMWTRIFRQKLIWTMVFALIIQVLIFTLLLHYWWTNHGFPASYVPPGQ